MARFTVRITISTTTESLQSLVIGLASRRVQRGVRAILTIAAGDTEGDIFIEVVDEDITEGDETVVVTLTTASAGATISTTAGESSATGTIESDDPEYLLLGRNLPGDDRTRRSALLGIPFACPKVRQGLIRCGIAPIYMTPPSPRKCCWHSF